MIFKKITKICSLRIIIFMPFWNKTYSVFVSEYDHDMPLIEKGKHIMEIS